MINISDTYEEFNRQFKMHFQLGHETLPEAVIE